tara:strand:- start:1009 stop:1188 length:180 start_codon:yes stop_codon:yes gene_type:complete
MDENEKYEMDSSDVGYSARWQDKCPAEAIENFNEIKAMLKELTKKVDELARKQRRRHGY